MMGIAVTIWNGMAPFASSKVWRRLFCLNAEAQTVECDRWYAALQERGVRSQVASAYLSLAPLLHEADALCSFLNRNPHWRSAIPDICSVQEALIAAEGDFMLSAKDSAALGRLLEAEPEWLLPPVSREAQEQGWVDEVMSMLFLTGGDWSVADAAEFPEELLDAALESEDDEDFDEVADEWYLWAVSDPARVLAIEQCCDDGVLLPAVERAERMATAPEPMRVEMDAFWAQCPKHVAALLAHRVYWVARSERGRRRGFAEWSPQYPLPPWWEDQEPRQTFERWCVAPESVDLKPGAAR
jgi:hypothetical protein